MKDRLFQILPGRKLWMSGILMITLLLASSPVKSQESQHLQQLIRQSEELGMNQQHVEQLRQRAGQQGYSEDQIAEFLQPAVNVASNDLPSEILLRKSLEGFAKNIPAQQIQQVLTRMEDGLGRAAGVVDPWMENHEVQEAIEREARGGDVSETARNFRNVILEGSVDALLKNVREELLADLLNGLVAENVLPHLGSGQVAAAMRVLPDMPTTVENPQMSNRILVKALSSGFDISELRQLPSAMQQAQRHSRMPAEAVAEGLHAHIGQGAPPVEVIRNMLQGNVGPPGMGPPGMDNRPDGRGRPE